MSEKKRSPVRDYLVYLVVRLLVCFLQTLSFRTACIVAGFLAWVAYKLNRRHRLVAAENLHKAYPGQHSNAEIDVMVRSVYQHFLTVLMEIIHLPRRMHVHNWKKFAAVARPRELLDALLCGRPLLVVTGHFGNWELAGYVFAQCGFTTHAIARPLDNPYLDDYLRSFRERTGQKLLAKQGDFDKIENTLAEGGVLATLADQDAGQRGVFVDYFGRPASTHKAVALMAIEHNVPMAVMGCRRENGMYLIETGDIILPEDYAADPQAVKNITQRFTSALETLVRRSPEQYFWLHRRWKHQPAPRKNKKAA